MAFLLPQLAFAQAPAQCEPTFCTPQHSRPAPRPSFAPFLSLVDEVINEYNREAQQEAKRQARRRAFNPRFDIREREEGYEVEAEVPGCEQENIDIEVSDEHTLRIAGNTAKKSAASTQPSVEQQRTAEPEKMEVEQPEGTKAPEGSETSSTHSHQATVEDDFEDLAAETSSLISHSSTPSTTSLKGKEKAVEVSKSTTFIQQQPQAQEPQQPQHREWLSERVQGSFERTFRFPTRIDGANVKASLKNGVLYIAVPKAPSPEVRRILIQ